MHELPKSLRNTHNLEVCCAASKIGCENNFSPKIDGWWRQPAFKRRHRRRRRRHRRHRRHRRRHRRHRRRRHRSTPKRRNQIVESFATNICYIFLS